MVEMPMPMAVAMTVSMYVAVPMRMLTRIASFRGHFLSLRIDRCDSHFAYHIPATVHASVLVEERYGGNALAAHAATVRRVGLASFEAMM